MDFYIFSSREWRTSSPYLFFNTIRAAIKIPSKYINTSVDHKKRRTKLKSSLHDILWADAIYYDIVLPAHNGLNAWPQPSSLAASWFSVGERNDHRSG
eukprot:SAG31_NODE_604_length_13629_cov_11.035994_17_plen_98_part_00